MFSWLDYAVFSASIVLSLAVGIYYAVSGGKQRTTSEYLMADKAIGIIPMSLSMAVSYLSSVAILGNSSELYYYGCTFIFYGIGNCIGMVAGSFLAVPIFYPLQVVSLNEYLTKRYNSRAVVMLGWLTQVLRQVVYCGVVIYGAAVMFEAMAGFPSYASILLLGLAGTFYTTLGGLKAVILTDVLQSCVMFGGLIIILIQGFMMTGGSYDIFATYHDEYRSQPILDPSPVVRQSVWIMLLAGAFSGYSSYAATQTGVQRICAMKSMRDAKIATFLSVFARFLLEALCSLCGIVAFSYYSYRGCDPLKAGYIHSPNQILPYYVNDVLSYWGIPGLFVAAVFCGALSTVSSCLNGIAAITWDDLCAEPLREWAEWKKALFTKMITVVSGIISLLISLLTTFTGGTVMQVGILFSSIAAAPAAVLFYSGALFPRIDWKSTLAASIFSMIVSSWLCIGAMFTKTHTAVLPTSILNCSSNEVFLTVNTSLSGNVTYTNMFSDVTTWPSAGAGDVGDQSSGISVLYTLSPYLIAPLIGALSILVALAISYLPGWNTKALVRQKELYCTFIRGCLPVDRNLHEDYKMVDT